MIYMLVSNLPGSKRERGLKEFGVTELFKLRLECV